MKIKITVGEKVFSQNDRGHNFYFIQSGAVRIFRESRGREIDLAVLEKGAVFGEMALIDGKPRSAGVLAMKDTELISLEKKDLRVQLEKLPIWYGAIVRVLSNKLRTLNENLSHRNHLQTISSVSRILVLMSPPASPDGGNDSPRLNLRRLLMELKGILGLNKDPLTKAFFHLEEKNLIQRNGGGLVIPDRTRLENYGIYLRNYNPAEKPEPLTEDLKARLSDLKNLLDKAFAQNEQPTFSSTHLQTELVSKLGLAEKEVSPFLTYLKKSKIIQIYLEDGRVIDDIPADKMAQIRFDAERITDVLQQEEFRCLVQDIVDITPFSL